MSDGMEELAPSTGFAPIARPDARVLILGSFPSQRSLDAGEYYAHPRNAFWPIMRELVGATGSYRQRCGTLMRHGIALWDVLGSSVRPGSMDADIRTESAKPNDFKTFCREHPDIGLICFNGRTAAALFRKFVDAGSLGIEPRQETLPSTSPAYASMPVSEKLDQWRLVMQHAIA
jgi:hypoxanthine-DNA glycosylase